MLVSFTFDALSFTRMNKGSGPIRLESPAAFPISINEDADNEKVKLVEGDTLYTLTLTPTQTERFLDLMEDDLAAFASGQITLPDSRKGRHITAGQSLADLLAASQADADADAPDDTDDTEEAATVDPSASEDAPAVAPTVARKGK